MVSFTTKLLLNIFAWLMTPVAAMFSAELGLVQDFAKNDNLTFGGSFNSLIKFNALVIPGLAMLVFLVWLATKGLTGGNSRTSTEDMFKRILGALVVSFVLSILVSPAEQLVGALDGALLNLVNANGQGLTHVFGAFAGATIVGGPEDVIVISLILVGLGLVLAGLLIIMLILAHAAAFLLIYFAPYLTLFRKDGFREAVEGLAAAISMPFIITSILAVGVATMGATGSLEPVPAALGHGVRTLNAMAGGHVVGFHIKLAGKTKPQINWLNYISNSISGLLILAAAIFLPKFILSMIFQAGNAIHDAFRSGQHQLAGKVSGALPDSKGKLARGGKWALSKAGIGAGTGGGDSNGGGTDSTTRAVDRENLQNIAANRGKNGPPGGAKTPLNNLPPSTSTAAGGVHFSSTEGNETQPQTDPAQTDQAQTPTEQIPTPAPAVEAEPNAGDGTTAAVAVLDSGDPENNGEGNAKPATPPKLTTREWVGSHYKGTFKAIPEALSNMPSVSENPLHMGLEARQAWRAAKRRNIQEVRGNLRAVKASAPPPPLKPDDGDKKRIENKSGALDGGEPPEVPNADDTAPEAASPKLPGD